MEPNNWHTLDLRSRRIYGPFDDELICLHLIPKSANRSERFEVGRLLTMAGKTWFIGNYSSREDVARLRRFYTVRWVHLPPTNRKEFCI